ncbi:MAG: alanine:cation symporter family protein [Anoxybacillus sp.]|nr:alanine/glycine:cation symporter family protein [Anoxybacillus sp.]MCL6587166.1 alanine:cation symporter family protein [Anoxybacillus sp.]
MELLSQIVGSINNVLWSYVLIALLLGLGVYFTIGTKFVQIRHLGEMFRVLKEKAPGSSNGEKEISSLQAFFIGAATRIGTGNVAGVAMAIAIGGPGAVFWMWLVAVLGGASAFVESTLAQIFKVKDKVGFKGGPGYYMEKQLGARWMSAIFAITIILSFGLIFNAVQSNTIAAAFKNSFHFNLHVTAILLVVLTAAIIFGGVTRIANFSSFIVPIMAGFYILLALYVMVTNITEIPAMLALIFKSAFGLEQAVGGGIGAAIMMGVKRGLFSNEAGMGSAPNAAATATVSHPVKQGFIQALGVFFDTLVVCSATAFIILLSDASKSKLLGIELTQAALSEHFGSWAGIFLSFAIFMFAFSSIIGSYYYGEANIGFISKSKTALFIYRLLALGLVYFGAVASIQIVWDLADLAMALMTLTNLVAIGLLGRIAFKALNNYMEQRKAGKDPVFYADDIEGLKGVEAWPTRAQAKKVASGE